MPPPTVRKKPGEHFLVILGRAYGGAPVLLPPPDDDHGDVAARAGRPPAPAGPPPGALHPRPVPPVLARRLRGDLQLEGEPPRRVHRLRGRVQRLRGGAAAVRGPRPRDAGARDRRQGRAAGGARLHRRHAGPQPARGRQGAGQGEVRAGPVRGRAVPDGGRRAVPGLQRRPHRGDGADRPPRQPLAHPGAARALGPGHARLRLRGGVPRARDGAWPESRRGASSCATRWWATRSCWW